MRIRAVATIVMVGALSVGSALSASATTASQRAAARYAIALKNWKVADQSYLVKRKAINVAYTIAVNLAPAPVKPVKPS